MTTTPEVPHPHLTTPDENGRLWAFRAVHPDFRSRDGYVWPFPGKVAKAAACSTSTTSRDARPHPATGSASA